MEQDISLTTNFYTKINDKNSELAHVYVSHRSIKRLHYTNRCILKIKNMFSSMRYREVYNFGNPCI